MKAVAARPAHHERHNRWRCEDVNVRWDGSTTANYGTLVWATLV